MFELPRLSGCDLYITLEYYNITSLVESKNFHLKINILYVFPSKKMHKAYQLQVKCITIKLGSYNEL